MRDYIPKVIGVESFEQHIGPYGGYNPTVDGSASNVFATAAFRFGHGTIPPILSRLNESFQEDRRFPHLRLQQALFSPWRIVKEGQCAPLRQPWKPPESHRKEETSLYLGQLEFQEKFLQS